MSGRILESYRTRPIQATLGGILSLAVLAHVGWVTAHGGLYHPEAPKNYLELDRVNRVYAVKHQTIDDLRAEASRDAYARATQLQQRELLIELDERIEEHKKLVRGQMPVPEGYSINMQDFVANDLRRLPKECQIDSPSMFFKTILFKSDDSYEILAASNEPSQKVFEDFLQRTIELEWLGEFVQFDEKRQCGFLLVSRDNMEIYIAVRTRDDVFPNFKTVVYWSLGIWPSEEEMEATNSSEWEDEW